MAGSRISIALAVLAAAWSAGPASASHTEQRHYSILVDGKEVGQSKLLVVEQDDGAVYVTFSAKVEVKQLVVNYNFTIEGQEWWKDGKLVGMKAFCNDNGKKCDLQVSHQAGQLRLRVNGMERVCRADVWTTSYWKLADARFHNKPVPLLTADNGQERVGQLQYIGAKQIPVGNQLVACFHFRITGAGNATDLWFDQHHRLVRQEFVESGHKTIVQLVSKK